MSGVAPEPIEIDEVFTGQPARVAVVSDDGGTIYLHLSANQTARVTTSELHDLAEGDDVLIGGNQIRPAAPGVWIEDRAIGVVRKVRSTEILVETGMGLRLIPRPSNLEIAPGFTVSYGDLEGVHEVIATTPIRVRDFGVDEEDAAEKYRVKPSEMQPRFADFGGYREVVERAQELIETQLDHKAELEAIGARPIKGVIFTGPPGTGKTLLARIIAAESGADFYLVSGPSIVSKWVGDSEETLRRIFEAASKSERAIIFFDEIDSLAEQRSGDTHEASKRLVAQLLTLMDGFDQNAGNVVVVAATNRINDIDIALRRPGRFDWEIEFGMPDAYDRLEILRVSMRNLSVVGELPLEEVAERTDGWSAAQVSSLWTEAALLAAADSRKSISPEDLAEAYERVNSRVARGIGEATNGH